MTLRFGLLGGSAGSFIGKIHRYGGELDDAAELCAGCFSRDEKKNLETGKAWKIDTDRIYSSYQEMAEEESKRSDKIDFVAIATPNAAHFQMAKTFMEHGFHVVCDKPMTITAEQGKILSDLAKEKGLLFAVTYTYSGFPMIREMKNIVQSGKLGKISMIVTEYPQGGRMIKLNNGTWAMDWHFDKNISGPGGSSFDVGTHVQYTTEYVTGKKTGKVLARMEHAKGSVLDTGGQVMVEFTDGTPGLYWFSQAASGIDNSMKIRIFGENGSLEWCHATAPFLTVRMNGLPEQTLSVAHAYLSDEAKSKSRLFAGHYEGFIGAFANIYNAFCSALEAKYAGEAYEIDFPTVEDGLESIRFVEACLESDNNGNVWVSLNP